MRKGEGGEELAIESFRDVFPVKPFHLYGQTQRSGDREKGRPARIDPGDGASIGKQVTGEGRVTRNDERRR